MKLPVVAYPGLALHALAVELPVPLEQLGSPPWLVELLRLETEAPVRGSEAVRAP